ncbi:hypothetical protein D7294_25020, partial [Streptomyces hoynatensis]
MTDTGQVPEAGAPERADARQEAHDQPELAPEQTGERHPRPGQPVAAAPAFPVPGEYQDAFPGEFPGEIDESADEAAEEEDLLMPGSSGAWAEGASRPAVIRPPAPVRRPAGTPTEPEYLDIAAEVGEAPPRLSGTLPPQPGAWAGARQAGEPGPAGGAQAVRPAAAPAAPAHPAAPAPPRPAAAPAPARRPGADRGARS